MISRLIRAFRNNLTLHPKQPVYAEKNYKCDFTISCQSEWLLSKSLQAINAGEGVEKREPSYTVGGNAN